MHARQAAEIQAAIGGDVRPARQGGAAQRHVFPPGLEGGGLAQGEDLGRHGDGEAPPAILLADVAGPVVVHLVVVVADQEGVGGVRGLQVGVQPVLGVALAVVGQGDGLLAQMLAHARAPAGLAGRAPAVFVDVVPVVEHEIEVGFLGDMAPGGEVAVLVVLAAGIGEADARGRAARGGRGAAAAHGADLRTRAEAIEKRPSGGQAGHLHMHRMGEFGAGEGRAAGQDAREAVVLGHLPIHRDGRAHHAAIGRQRFRGEACPDDEAIRRGVAAGHAQGEGEGAEHGLRQGAARHGRDGRERRKAGRPAQQPAARKVENVSGGAVHGQCPAVHPQHARPLPLAG